MPSYFFITWFICASLCLCYLVYSLYGLHVFQNSKISPTKTETDFVNHYIKIIETYQSNYDKHDKHKKQVMRFLIAKVIFFVFVLMFVIFGVYYWGLSASHGLTDFFGKRPSSYLKKPGHYPEPILNIGAKGLILILSFHITQNFYVAFTLWKEKRTLKDFRLNWLVPIHKNEANSEAYQEAVQKKKVIIISRLYFLIRNSGIKHSKNYTLDELTYFLNQLTIKRSIKIGLVSSASLVLIFILQMFSFVRVTSSEIIYSSPYSFEVARMDIDSVADAKFLCSRFSAGGLGRSYLFAKVKLNDGFEFKVGKEHIQNMVGLTAHGRTLPLNLLVSEFDEANQRCLKSK